MSVFRMEDLADRTEWPRGVYLFTDLDGMNAAQTHTAQWLYDRLSSCPEGFAPLNEPKRIVGRYELCRKLYEIGINDFNVHRVKDLPAPVRYPAFLRHENYHRANVSPVVGSQCELEDEIAKLLIQGGREEEYLVVEHIDYKDDDGFYRKYAAQKIGPHVFGKHLMAGPHWMIKRKTTTRDAVGIEELPYVRECPHRGMLEPVFEISGHDWARVDYSFYKGRMQVWEVNDNPELGTKWRRDFGRWKVNTTIFPNFVRAFDEVSKGIEPGPPARFRIQEPVIAKSEAVEKIC